MDKLRNRWRQSPVLLKFLLGTAGLIGVLSIGVGLGGIVGATLLRPGVGV